MISITYGRFATTARMSTWSALASSRPLLSPTSPPGKSKWRERRHSTWWLESRFKIFSFKLVFLFYFSNSFTLTCFFVSILDSVQVVAGNPSSFARHAGHPRRDSGRPKIRCQSEFFFPFSHFLLIYHFVSIFIFVFPTFSPWNNK